MQILKLYKIRIGTSLKMGNFLHLLADQLWVFQQMNNSMKGIDLSHHFNIILFQMDPRASTFQVIITHQEYEQLTSRIEQLEGQTLQLARVNRDYAKRIEDYTSMEKEYNQLKENAREISKRAILFAAEAIASEGFRERIAELEESSAYEKARADMLMASLEQMNADIAHIRQVIEVKTEEGEAKDKQIEAHTNLIEIKIKEIETIKQLKCAQIAELQNKLSQQSEEFAFKFKKLQQDFLRTERHTKELQGQLANTKKQKSELQKINIDLMKQYEDILDSLNRSVENQEI